ncbi:hypothetical protein CCHR01_14844 [Colletotrichum chrysophilum]|uniref:C2H2-type domain-containing protein n=1 Tax=Colletotrichum chrysophilum TaxID=1836956 RepID=A0AAD9EBH3_9PEZI|nr:hypothetical protein CCHR01_14844 [Colletotrichum chrysophilum]
MGSSRPTTSPFKCPQPSCQSTTYSTRSNLARHMRSKHGPKARMACGEERANHTSNKKRHERNCKKCNIIATQQGNMTSTSGHDHESPSDLEATSVSDSASITYNNELDKELLNLLLWTDETFSYAFY